MSAYYLLPLLAVWLGYTGIREMLAARRPQPQPATTAAPRTHTIDDIVIHYDNPDPGDTMSPWQRMAWALVVVILAGLVVSLERCGDLEDGPAGTALVRADAPAPSRESTR